MNARLALSKLRLTELLAPYPTDATTAPQRRGMKMLWWDNILSAISGSFYGDFEVLYLLALGATSSLIGVRASINSAAALLAPLLGAWLVERTGKRKLWVLLAGGGLGRLALLLLVFIPFVFAGQAGAIAFVTLVALQSLVGSISGPAGNSLFGDIVPLPIRSRFLGLQMMAANVAHLAFVPLAGWLIKQIGGIPGYQVTIAMAAMIGFVATSLYARIPEPETVEGKVGAGYPHTGFVGGLRLFLQDRRFLMFCLINFVWTLGIQFSGPFFYVHMVKNLGFGVDTISYVVTVSLIANIIAFRFAGGWADRLGPERMTALGMLLVPFMPIAWIFARTPFEVILARSYGFIAWAGFHVASMPLILKITPPEHRSQFIAIFGMINGIAAIIGPLPASWIFEHWGFTANLLFSAAGRGLGGLLFLLMLLKGGLRSPGAHQENQQTA